MSEVFNPNFTVTEDKSIWPSCTIPRSMDTSGPVLQSQISDKKKTYYELKFSSTYI